MAWKIKKFVGLAKLELIDLMDDIDLTIERMKRDLEAETITNYLFKENLTVYENELIGIRLVIKSLDAFILERYESIDALLADVDACVKKIFSDRGLFEAGYRNSMERITRAGRYIAETSTASED